MEDRGFSKFQCQYSATLDRNIDDSDDDDNEIALGNPAIRSRYSEGGSVGKKAKSTSVNVLFPCVLFPE